MKMSFLCYSTISCFITSSTMPSPISSEVKVILTHVQNRLSGQKILNKIEEVGIFAFKILANRIIKKIILEL
jgi:hypothetical protein